MVWLLACAVDTEDTEVATDTAEDTADCPAIETGVLQEVIDSSAGPYFVRHPLAADDDTPTIVYLPGGDGSRASAEIAERLYLHGEGAEAFRVAVLYTDGARDFRANPDRAVDVRDEVLRCFGGDSAAVHLGGTSNGGLGAFSLFVDAGDGFASLLGAPGAWSSFDEDAVVAAIGDRPVFMGVGELDTSWQEPMVEQAEALAARGVAVTYAVFAGQGHVLEESYDETELFDFWRGAGR